MLNEPLSHSLLDYFFGCSHANDVEHEINKWFSNWFSAFLFVCVSVAFIGDKLFDWFSSLPALLGRSHLRQSLTSFKPPSSGKKKRKRTRNRLTTCKRKKWIETQKKISPQSSPWQSEDGRLKLVSLIATKSSNHRRLKIVLSFVYLRISHSWASPTDHTKKRLCCAWIGIEAAVFVDKCFATSLEHSPPPRCDRCRVLSARNHNRNRSQCLTRSRKEAAVKQPKLSRTQIRPTKLQKHTDTRTIRLLRCTKVTHVCRWNTKLDICNYIRLARTFAPLTSALSVAISL